MHEEIYEKLKHVARRRTVVHYSEIAPLAGLDMQLPYDRKQLGDLLGDISTYEHRHGRPMLSAVVVHAEDGRPGKGFFQLARLLGLLHKSGDDEVFFAGELQRVHDHWGR